MRFFLVFFSHLLVVPSKISANLYHEGYKCLDKARPMALLILRWKTVLTLEKSTVRSAFECPPQRTVLESNRPTRPAQKNTRKPLYTVPNLRLQRPSKSSLTSSFRNFEFKNCLGKRTSQSHETQIAVSHGAVARLLLGSFLQCVIMYEFGSLVLQLRRFILATKSLKSNINRNITELGRILYQFSTSQTLTDLIIRLMTSRVELSDPSRRTSSSPSSWDDSNVHRWLIIKSLVFLHP